MLQPPARVRGVERAREVGPHAVGGDVVEIVEHACPSGGDDGLRVACGDVLPHPFGAPVGPARDLRRRGGGRCGLPAQRSRCGLVEEDREREGLRRRLPHDDRLAVAHEGGARAERGGQRGGARVVRGRLGSVVADGPGPEVGGAGVTGGEVAACASASTDAGVIVAIAPTSGRAR